MTFEITLVSSLSSSVINIFNLIINIILEKKNLNNIILEITTYNWPYEKYICWKTYFNMFK